MGICWRISPHFRMQQSINLHLPLNWTIDLHLPLNGCSGHFGMCPKMGLRCGFASREKGTQVMCESWRVCPMNGTVRTFQLVRQDIIEGVLHESLTNFPICLSGHLQMLH